MSDTEFNIARFIDRPNELKNVPFNLIDADFSRNKRVDYGDIQWLADSILTNGLKNPLVLYVEACSVSDEKALFYSGSKSQPKGYYKLVVQDGHRRFKALSLVMESDAGTEKFNNGIPCRGTSKAESTEERLLNQLLMNAGKNFEPLETQAVYKELYNLGWDEQKIATKTGVSPTHVKRMLELSSTDELTKYMIERGEVTASLVLEVLGDVRQLAQLEGKREFEVFKEIADKTKRTKKGGVSAKEFKENLTNRKVAKLSQDDPMYFYTLSAKELLERVSVSIVVNKKDCPWVSLTVPKELWDAIQKKVKE